MKCPAFAGMHCPAGFGFKILTEPPDGLYMTGKRHFPPLYKSTGDLISDRLAFFHILERLKVSVSIGFVS